MKALRKGIIFTICLMLVFSLVGQKEKRQELTLDQMGTEIAKQGLTFTEGKASVSDVPLENLSGTAEPPGLQQTGKFSAGSETEPGYSDVAKNDYPESWGDPYYFWTTRVVVADLDKPSEDTGYSDFTNLTAHLIQGKTYSVSLEHYGMWTFPKGWKIWIDYNKDKDFDDAGECEEVFSAFRICTMKGGGCTVEGSITVPCDAPIGDTRMRVSMGSYDAIPFEGSIGYGEVEDYTANITSNRVGNTNAFSSKSTTANRRAMPFTMPEDGTIISISIYHEGSPTGNDRMILAVYDDEEGAPHNRLAITPTDPEHPDYPDTYVSTSPGWQTIKLRSCTFVSGGSTVWLAWVFQSNPGVRYQTGSPGRSQSPETWSGGMPYNFGSGTQANYVYSIYANYNPCGSFDSD